MIYGEIEWRLHALIAKVTTLEEAARVLGSSLLQHRLHEIERELRTLLVFFNGTLTTKGDP